MDRSSNMFEIKKLKNFENHKNRQNSYYKIYSHFHGTIGGL